MLRRHVLATALVAACAAPACKETAPPVLSPPQPTYAEDSGRHHPARGPARAARRARLAARPDGDRQARRRAPAAARGVRHRPRRRSPRDGRRSRRCSPTAEPRCGRRRRSASGCSATRRPCRRCSPRSTSDAVAARPRPRRRGARPDWRSHRRRRRLAPSSPALVASGALASVQADESTAGRSRPRSKPSASASTRWCGSRRPTCCCRRSSTREGRPRVRLVADRLRAAPHRGSAHAGPPSSPAQGRRLLQRRLRGAGARACRSSPRRGAARCSTCWRRRRRGRRVRLQAVRGLGRLGDPRAIAPLIALLDEPTRRSGAAARGRDRARRAQGGAGHRSRCSIAWATRRRRCGRRR